MTFETESPTHQQILREEQARLFGNVAGARVLAIPLFAALLLCLAWFEPIGWRRAVLVTLSVLVPTFFLVELRRYRRVGFEPRTILRNVALTAAAQLLATSATGGILSPVIYGVVPIAGVAATLMGNRQRLLVAAGQITGVFALAILAYQDAPGFATPGLTTRSSELPGAYYFFHATVLSLVTLGVGQVSNFLSGAFAGVFRRATRAQEQLLESHASRVKELTTLSAEIAHELKNPLASTKGLSAMLVQNITDERGNERLRVLRREIDRMETVLEEFLNFSRPLVPLSLARSDLHALTEEVLMLHEGLARQRNVSLVLDGTVAEASCDPNKVKQIVINLVQNALDASPSGGELHVAVEPTDDAVVIRVVDQGPGLDDELGDVFQPGVTSKSGGSGIGLTIARSLARQHGGELTLTASPDGGARAQLRLPKEPPALSSEEVA